MKPRVAQWGRAGLGPDTHRALAEHPGLELVGVVAELDELGARRPDCVVYTPAALDVDVVVRLLESGANVVTNLGELQRPPNLEPKVRSRLEAACARGSSTLHSTGGIAGLVGETLVLVLLSAQRRFDRLAVEESHRLGGASDRVTLADCGLGRPAGGPEPDLVREHRSALAPTVDLVADALSLPLDAVEAHVAEAVATQGVALAAGTVAAGAVAARRVTVAGVRGGRDVLRMRTTWHCTADLAPAWELAPAGWSVAIGGDASLALELHLGVPGAERVAAANRVVNAVLAVCAAPPGIVSTLELRHVVPTLG